MPMSSFPSLRDTVSLKGEPHYPTPELLALVNCLRCALLPLLLTSHTRELDGADVGRSNTVATRRQTLH